ncbi:hypothetical protein B0H10DRAFT_2436374, partial [Mycena sp. CBHHK59/15]
MDNEQAQAAGDGGENIQRPTPSTHADGSDRPLQVVSTNSSQKIITGAINQFSFSPADDHARQKLLSMNGDPQPSDAALTLDSYVQELISVLQLASIWRKEPSRRPQGVSEGDTKVLIANYVVLNCMGKIRRRATIVKKTYLSTSLLNDWRVSNTDKITTTLVPVRSEIIRGHLLDARVEEAPESHFVFDAANAPRWLDAICRSIGKLLDFAVKADVRKVVQLSIGTHKLIKIAAPLWTIASLEAKIGDLHDEINRPMTPANQGSESTDPEETGEDDEEEEQLGSSSITDTSLPQTALPNLSVFARAIDAVCSWPIAAIALTGSRLWGNSPINVSFVDLARQPIENGTDLSVLECWQTTGRWFDRVSKQVKPILEMLQNKGDFSRGATHCEAGLLAFILQSGPNEPAVFPEIRDQMANSTQIAIGVGRKCCPLCRLLSTIVSKRLRIEIELPGQHTQYFPWVPPHWLP